MNKRSRYWGVSCCFGIAVLALVGCGGSGNVKVSGTISDGGNPLEVSDQGDIQVEFIQLDGDKMTGNTFNSSVGKDGKYEVELPKGEYRISVKQLDPYPDVDKLEGKFGQENSPIKQTIEGADTLDIDVSKY